MLLASVQQTAVIYPLTFGASHGMLPETQLGELQDAVVETDT